MDLADKLKHAVFTDEGDIIKPVAPAPVHQAAVPPTPVSGDDETYQRLKSETLIESSPVFAKIHQFLDPLQGIPESDMNSKLKFTTALLQAKAQTGLTAERVLGVFDEMQQKLADIQEAFNEQVTGFVSDNIDTPNRRLAEISKQLEQLESEQRQLLADVAAASQRVNTNKGNFVAALNLRAKELLTERAAYAALLKG